jgi:hypothetical protein
MLVSDLIVTSAPRLALLACTLFLLAFQIRYSIETWEARNTFLFIPFQLTPCTNTIEAVGYAEKDVLHASDALIAVNGRSFTGASVYHQELRAAGRYLDAANRLPSKELVEALSRWPFRVTVRFGTADARTVNVHFAHCTCGSLSSSQVVWYCILPPVICILLGLVVATVNRSQSVLPWLFLAVAVCLSLVTIVPEPSSHWSQTANPLEWRDWFRVPALAFQSFFSASWSAWLLLFAVYCFRQNAKYLIACWAVAPMFAVAVVKTLIAIGSSECFRLVAPIHRVMEAASMEISIALLFCTGLVPWAFGRIWAIASTILAACAAILLCWPASPPAFHATWMFENIAYLRTPEVVSACFTAAVLLVAVNAGWQSSAVSAKPTQRSTSGVLGSLSMVLLLVPFLYSALSGVLGLWWTPFVPQGVLASLYVGLLGSAWFVFRTATGATGQLIENAMKL